MPGLWLGRQESNLGMQAPKARALPLGYAPDVISKLRTLFRGVGVFCRVQQHQSDGPISSAYVRCSSLSAALRGFPAATDLSSSSYAAKTAFSIFSRIKLLIG